MIILLKEKKIYLFLLIEKQSSFLDPFVLDQLQAGNFLVRQTTFEVSNLSIHVLANDHSKSKKSRKLKVKLLYCTLNTGFGHSRN